MPQRDGYSNFKFFQALAPFITTDPPAHDGIPIDTLGYDTCTVIVNVGDLASVGAGMAVDDFHQFKLEHAHGSISVGICSGPDSVWSECYPSEMIHSVVGAAGAYSTLNSGIFQSIISSSGAQGGSNVFVVGYKGLRRYVRLYLSGELTPSTMYIGAVAILGLPADWAVNDPVSSA